MKERVNKIFALLEDHLWYNNVNDEFKILRGYLSEIIDYTKALEKEIEELKKVNNNNQI